jgi:guanylate kinase
MKTKGILIVVSGFAGAGKGTLVNELLKQFDNYALSISATTRKPRGQEVDGKEYFFKSVEEFEKMIAQGDLIEYANYVGNYYGTPKTYVEEQLNAGKDVILEIEIQGALKVKEKFPETLLLFVTPPSAAILKDRLVGRGTETMDVVEMRMRRAAEEAEGLASYDYIVVNDDLQTCVKQMHNIIQSEHYKTHRNVEFMTQIKEELKANLKGE